MLGTILNDLQTPRGERVALLVNNLGATPTMELVIVARHALAVLERRGLNAERVYLGTFLSALEMAGVSLSVLPLDDNRLARLDAPTIAPAWPNAANRSRSVARPPAPAEPPTIPRVPSGPPRTTIGKSVEAAILRVVHALTTSAPRLTELDQAVGDGDLGISLTRGSRAMQEALPTLPLDDAAATLNDLGIIIQNALGGTSGPLYAAMLLRASSQLRDRGASDPKAWSAAFRAGCDAVGTLGGASAGDRTMLDALLPAATALDQALTEGCPLSEALHAAATAAEKGVQATAAMPPRRGRSSYLGQRALGHPDPGAEAVAVWVRAIADAES